MHFPQKIKPAAVSINPLKLENYFDEANASKKDCNNLEGKIGIL